MNNTNRYARQQMIPEYQDLDKRLEQNRIAIVGSGGLGGLCSYLLVGAGALNINIADYDTIDETNLHRQILYREKDIGEKKINCCKRELVELDKRANINTFAEKITKANFQKFTEGCRLVLDLSDNIETRLSLNSLCFANRIDLIHASVTAETALLAYFKFSDSKFIDEYGCYECLAGENATTAKKGITGPFASAVSAFVANLTMQVFTDRITEKLGKIYLFDLNRFSIKSFSLKKSPLCKCCGTSKEVS
jgi:molybdopterin/thiamine biosynthesis adenylyltransferase